MAMFGWQWGVLSQCTHVTMAQSNLQCDYYCPQMAAIKYEKDRAANTLLPNYNTYGRYDIPAYYESYWQSPEERYYTALFVVQILCLISSFFLLFSSVALIYAVQTWSRFLVWPWVVTMLCSILTSLAYCITWWSGDVRDYWLVLTILEFFGVVINCYCFVVVWVFYQNMADELRYYEGRKNKYDRFSQRENPPTIEEEIDDDDTRIHSNRPSTGRLTIAPRCRPERFDTLPIDEQLGDPFDEVDGGRLQPAHSMPTLFDDFHDVPRQHHRESTRRRRRRKQESCSSTCSTDLTTEDTVSTQPHGRRRHRSHHDHHRRRSHSRGHVRERLSDEESQPTVDLSFEKPRGRRHEEVIPPENDTDPTTSGQPRKYQINSEIVISYDPRQQGGASRPESRQHIGQLDLGGVASSRPPSDRAGHSGRPPFPPVSITSNV
ncbi:hypothetical protein M3Y99_01965600 [Aphelenchoides fujianensis]|nr:hypothetical protein M3Y99_01965600 [Aphelenchoides fujianensis]